MASRLIWPLNGPSDKRPIVMLLDISGSCRSASELMLTFMYQVKKVFPGGCKSYAFVNSLYDISKLFDVPDSDSAIKEVLNTIPTRGVYSDYGRPLKEYREQHMSDINKDTIILWIGDARNNQNPSEAETFKNIVRRGKKTYWLNTEKKSQWSHGDSIFSEYARYCTKYAEAISPAELIGFLTQCKERQGLNMSSVNVISIEKSAENEDQLRESAHSLIQTRLTNAAIKEKNKKPSKEKDPKPSTTDMINFVMLIFDSLIGMPSSVRRNKMIQKLRRLKPLRGMIVNASISEEERLKQLDLLNENRSYVIKKLKQLLHPILDDYYEKLRPLRIVKSNPDLSGQPYISVVVKAHTKFRYIFENLSGGL